MLLPGRNKVWSRVRWRPAPTRPPSSHTGRHHRAPRHLHTETTTPPRPSPCRLPLPRSSIPPSPSPGGPAMTQLSAPDLSHSHRADHVAAVATALQRTGLVKVTLQFRDDSSTYLANLIRSLHARHGHLLPLAHSATRGWFWDVRPRPPTSSSSSSDSSSGGGCQTKARSETMEDFPWHTDCSYEQPPPRYFALQVLQHDRRGGGTLSLLHAATLAARLSPSARAALARPDFRIAVPAEFAKRGQDGDEGAWIRSHILTATTEANHDVAGDVGNILIRFRSDIVTPLTPAAGAALAELDGALGGASATIDLAAEDLPTGSVVMIDNRRWLHARNHVADPERHLRRVRWDASPFPAVTTSS